MFSFIKNKLKVVTHDGGFHPDEVFACATLLIWADKNNCKLKIIRTRDKQTADNADMVLDVGMEYDPKKNRFDHHQNGGAGVRDNGIPYASFGLVWKKYGEEICGSKEITDIIDKKLVLPIDARDNGINLNISNTNDIVDYRTNDAISNFNITWMENFNKNDRQFKKALSFAKEILEREIIVTQAKLKGSELTKEAILKQGNPDVLILDKYFNWEETVSRFKGIRIVVYRHKNEKDWCVQVGRDNIEDYNSDRIKLPANWSGLRDGELEGVSGVKGAVFCANGGWFAVARTKEGAIELAKKALQIAQN